MGEVLLVCSLITLVLVVYFIYIKEKEEKNMQIERNRQAYYKYKNDPRYSKYNERTNNMNYNINSNFNNVGRSGEYLKFLKFKNTPPPQDLKPKKLKYENYNNLLILENYYNYNQKHLNILTPTPFKHDQVLAGNIQIENKIKNVYQVNTNSNINFNDMDKNWKDTNRYYINESRIPKDTYISKYPVEISYKKRQLTKLDLMSYNGPNASYNRQLDFLYKNKNESQAVMNNPNFNKNYINNRRYININNNNDPSHAYFPNKDNNMNKLSYKVINAEEFLKKNKNQTENTTDRKNTLSVSPLGFVNNIQQHVPRINKVDASDVYNNNGEVKPAAQNFNYMVNPGIKQREEDEIIPRKLKFTDSSFDKFKLITNKKMNSSNVNNNFNFQDDEWYSPLN